MARKDCTYDGNTEVPVSWPLKGFFQFQPWWCKHGARSCTSFPFEESGKWTRSWKSSGRVWVSLEVGAFQFIGYSGWFHWKAVLFLKRLNELWAAPELPSTSLSVWSETWFSWGKTWVRENVLSEMIPKCFVCLSVHSKGRKVEKQKPRINLQRMQALMFKNWKVKKLFHFGYQR